VEQYGGEIKLIKFSSGYSSSAIIEKISLQAVEQILQPAELENKGKVPVVFLDRDGTINEEVSYLHEPEKLKLIPGAIEGLKRLREAGFALIMVTNQPGIGLGYFAKEDFFKVTRALFMLLSKERITFSKVYFCPHSESERCGCRKPAPGMIERAMNEMNIDMDNSFMVGDMTSDIELGRRLGLRTILLECGAAGSDRRFNVQPTATLAGLLEAADYIIESSQKKQT